MKVNFNDISPVSTDRKYKITAKSILSIITDEDIFRKYIKYNFKMNKPFSSPLRKDEHPSFVIFFSGNTGKAIYHDHATSISGDCFSFIQELYGISFSDVLSLIERDFNLNVDSNTINDRKFIRKPLNSLKQRVTAPETIIDIVSQPFTSTDYKYWTVEYKIDFEYLRIFNVHSCKKVYLNNKLKFTYSIRNPIYAYQFEDKYKIYRPLNNKRYKWIGNVKSNVLQGWHQLDKTEELLIITKSMKDIILLYILGYNAVAPQGESIMIEEEVMEELKTRFKNIIMFYDNDNAGISGSRRYKNLYNIDSIFLPLDSGKKDISDFVSKYGIEYAKEFLIYNLY